MALLHVPLGERLFGALLVCFPAEFRERFGASMLATFRQGVASRHGAGRFRFVLRACLGAMTSGLAERRAARRRALVRSQDARALTIVDRVRDVAQDIRIAIRMMRRQPGISLLSIVTLMVGISASAAVFSLIDAALLRPVALPASQRLVAIETTLNGEAGMSAFEDVRDWIRDSTSFEALAAFRPQTANLTGMEVPVTVRGGFVIGDFFGMAGVHPAMGRALGPADAQPASPPAVVISDLVWRRQFQRDPAVLGRVMYLNNIAFTVVGVMPAGFEFPYDGVDVWMPARFHTGTMSRGARTIVAFGRLKPGVTVNRAQTELAAIAANLAVAYPNTNRGRGVKVVSLHEWLTADMRDQLTMLFGLVLVLLVAACANVASLQVGAAARRRSEIGVRMALGAGRLRVARQLLTEHLVIAAVAGGLAVLVARLIVPAVTRYALAIPTLNVFGLDRVVVDGRVIAFAMAVTIVTGLASGLVPAAHWARQAPGHSIRDSTRTMGERRLTRTRRWLVIGQVAMAAILITAGGLLVKSYLAMLRVDLGFDPAGVWSLEYRLPANKYRDPAAQTAFHDEIAARVAAIPGVRRAAVARGLPLSGNGDLVQALSDRAAPGTESWTVGFNTVSDDYFAAMGVPLLEGRTFEATDRAGAPFVVVISRSLAARLWPGESALGRTIVAVGSPLRPRVIGVVGDLRHYRLAEDPIPMAYARNAQNPGIFMTVVAKVDGVPGTIGEQLKAAVWSVDRDQPVWKVRTLASLVEAATSGTRFLFAALMIFAAAAALLVAAGLYGAISQGVNERGREIAVRMALGAKRRSVLRQVLAAGLTLTSIGLAIGLAGSIAVSRLLEAALYRTSPFDLVPYLATAVVLGAIATLACYLPARVAASVDPARALKE